MTAMTIEITNDRSRIDAALLHRWLAEDSYWARNVPLATVERSIAHSLCFTAFDGDQQVAFARVITDYATMAYLADVYVTRTHRGRGISKQLMLAIREHPELQTLRRWMLVTRDAHGLYEQFGFVTPAHPDRYMELLKPHAPQSPDLPPGEDARR